jgi:hypothetical protein
VPSKATAASYGDPPPVWSMVPLTVLVAVSMTDTSPLPLLAT